MNYFQTKGALPVKIINKSQYFIILFVLLLFILSEIVFFNKDLEKEKKETYIKNENTLNNMMKYHKENIQILANVLASDSEVIQAYQANNPELIKQHVQPIWDKVKNEKLAYEIHFFKPPAISFVNFSNFESIGKDISDVRTDIKWVTSSFKPSAHIMMCKTYAGQRVTYPIVDKDGTMLGGLSLGKKIDWIPSFIKEATNKNSFLIYNKKATNTLISKYYSSFISDKILVNEYILANQTIPFKANSIQKIDFSKKIQDIVIGEKLYSLNIFPVIDFNNDVMGYVSILNTLDNFYSLYIDIIINKIIILLITGFLMYFLFKRENNKLLKKAFSIKMLSKTIKNNDFNYLHNYKKEDTIEVLSSLEDNIISMGKVIENKYSELEQEMKSQLQNLKQAQSIAKIGSYELDIISNKIKWSDEHYKIFKLDKEHFKPTLKKFMKFVHPDDLEYVEKNLSESATTKNQVAFSYRIILDDNSELYVRSTSSITKFDYDGTPLQISGTIQDITEYTKLEEQNKYASQKLIQQLYKDEVTNIPNRNAFFRDLKLYPNAYLALLNIKSFRYINSVLGFEIGNYALKELAIILSTMLDDNNRIYRIGGDEIALLNIDSSKNELFEKYIANMIEEIDEIELYSNGDKVSVNIHLYAGISYEVDKKLESAVIALNEAKKANINYMIYTSSNLQIKQEESLKMTNKIKDALKDDNIIVYYQPIVDKNEKINKYEALVRMRDGEKVLSPFFFLDIAKQTKYYHQITHIVIQKTFQLFKDKNESFSINLTAEDILNKQIVQYIKTQLLEIKDVHRVVFEIVESDDIYDVVEVEEFIQWIKESGASIAIDDFGTGYANFSYMMKIKPTYLKIDGSLIKDLDTNENAKKIVKTIVVFAKELGIKTISEYVHSKEIFDICKELDIDEFQGFYFSEPLKKSDL